MSIRGRSNSERWGWVAISLHWLSALLVFGLFGLGLWMTSLGFYHPWYHDGPDLHRGLGVLLLLLTLARLAWRAMDGRPDELAEHQWWERLAARWMHRALYLLLLAVMVSGYLITTADGRALEVFGLFSIPATLSGLDQQEDIAGAVHLVLASTLVALALMHAGAALKHHLIDKDKTLMRMLCRS